MKQSRKPAYFAWGIPVVILLLIWVGFALRLFNLEAFSFWTDEGLTPLRAGYPLAQLLRNDVVIQGIVTKDTHPPFFYLLIYLTRPLFGETDFAYRFPSVLASVLLIPLMHEFGRRLHGRSLGLLAAALTAVNPLQIWYANEARMYTLYTLLMAGATYALWRALEGSRVRRWLALYVVLAGLGLYTHYTAVFLIGAQVVFATWLLWQRGQKKVITLIVVVGVLSLIPRLIPFTVPRLFTGTEANYFYVSPLTMLKDVARFFSMGVTVDFNQTVIQLLAATAVGFVLLGLYAARTWQRRLFLLAYLLAVVAGLMVGSLLFKPMYQGVRHIMVGSPAFLLLMAWGVLFAWEQSRRETAVRYVWAVVGGVGLLSAFLGPFIALNNLYNQHEIYAKDDFRALIAQMEALAGDNDVIVYNNAIHLPLHEHYQTRFDIAVTAVPSYPSLASDTAVTELLRLAETYDRIWFVTDPPADHRDDDHLAQQWLAANLVQVARNQAHARTTVVESLTFNTAPVQVEALPENGRSLDIHWPSLPALRGVALDSVALDGAQPITQAALWFDLFWDAAPSAPDVPLNFRLQDPTGKEWLNNIQPLWTGSASPWPTSGLSRQPYQLILPTGLPPGSYTLFAQPLLADSITPMGDAYPILDLETGAGAGMPVAHWPKNHHIRFDNGLQLLGWETGDIEVRPGHTLPLTLYWQADRPVAPEALSYELAVIAPDGTLERSQSDSPGANGLAEWPLGVPIRQQTGLYFRPETEPGRYQLRWQLRQGDEVVAGRPLGRPWSTGSIILGEVTVIPWPLETDLPTDVERSATTFGPINLYGYRVDASQPNQITLDLVWQAQTEPEVNFLLFVHLVDEADNIVAQVDRLPGNTLRPTNGWRQGEVITDTLTLNLPPDLPAGAYHIRVGFFDPDTGERLPAADEGAPQANDQAQITTVTMP